LSITVVLADRTLLHKSGFTEDSLFVADAPPTFANQTKRLGPVRKANEQRDDERSGDGATETRDGMHDVKELSSLSQLAHVCCIRTQADLPLSFIQAALRASRHVELGKPT